MAPAGDDTPPGGLGVVHGGHIVETIPPGPSTTPPQPLKRHMHRLGSMAGQVTFLGLLVGELGAGMPEATSPISRWAAAAALGQNSLWNGKAVCGAADPENSASR